MEYNKETNEKTEAAARRCGEAYMDASQELQGRATGIIAWEAQRIWEEYQGYQGKKKSRRKRRR